MGLISWIKGWFNRMLLIDSRIKDEFDVEPISSTAMDKYIKRCMDIYCGMPDWVDPDGHIKTVNVAKSVCSEVARLTTLAIGIKIDWSARAKWLQEQIDAAYSSFRDWTEYGCAAGNMILKPNGEGIDFVMPDRYKIVDMANGAITGIVFIDRPKHEKKCTPGLSITASPARGTTAGMRYPTGASRERAKTTTDAPYR